MSLSHNVIAQNRVPGRVIYLFIILLASAFVIKKAVNLGVVVLFIYSLYSLRSDQNLISRSPGFVHFLSAVMLFPLVLSLSLDGLKGTVNWAQLDEYMRIAMAVPILYFLIKHVRPVHLTHFLWLYAIGFLCFCAAYWSGYGDRPWAGDRFVTYFVDPSVAGLAACIGTGILTYAFTMSCSRPTPMLLRFSLFFGALFACYALYASETRSAWGAFLVILVSAVLLPRKFVHRLALVLLLVGGLLLAFFASDTLQERSGLVVQETREWLDGSNKDGSAGQRLSILMGGLKLASEHPWLGRTAEQHQHEVLTRAAELKLTDASMKAWAYGGTHNHFLEKLISNGVLGLLAALSLVIAPLVFFLGHLQSESDVVRDSAVYGTVLCLAYLVCGIGNILTLKFVNSFYAGLLVFLVALIVSATRQKSKSS